MDQVIPIAITQNIIFDYCDGDDQLKLRHLFYDRKLKITNLYDISRKLSRIITDNFLKRHKYVKKLKARYGITDKGIKELNLHTLEICCNADITDEGIKGMNLHTLLAPNNTNITDEGIRGMKLRVLDASGSCMITDKGIKGMNLHTLNASANCMITNKGIKGMNIRILDISGPEHVCKITNEGIKRMNLHTLNASWNMGITDEGIQGMNLHTLCAAGNLNITNKGIRGMDLHTLNAVGNPKITYEGIQGMNIHTLNASSSGITRDKISDMDIQTLHIGPVGPISTCHTHILPCTLCIQDDRYHKEGMDAIDPHLNNCCLIRNIYFNRLISL